MSARLPTRDQQALAVEAKRATLVTLAQNPVVRGAYAVNRVLGSKPFDATMAALMRVGVAPEHLPSNGSDGLEIGTMSKAKTMQQFATDLGVHLEQSWLMEVNMAVHALRAQN